MHLGAGIQVKPFITVIMHHLVFIIPGIAPTDNIALVVIAPDAVEVDVIILQPLGVPVALTVVHHNSGIVAHHV
jgi:hypothetical protein